MSELRTVIGIDLGTTFSVVAHVDTTGRPVSIVNAEGDLTTPSVVFFDDDQIVVGKEAVKAAAFAPHRVARWVKREMGQPVYSVPINGEFLPPEVIQSLVLEKLRKDVAPKLGSVRNAVITVPAYFNEPRRKATQDAGRMAGLTVMDIINEPTAAAIAYGVQSGFLTEAGASHSPEKILVFDLGGGTLDVTLTAIDGKNYTVLATDGDVKLGGIDWDQRIVERIAKEFERQFGVDPSTDPAANFRLHREAEDAKRTLSTREKVTITFEHQGRATRLTLTREEFEEMSADLLERTRFTVAHLLEELHLGWQDITRILLVGGSTRMPMISAMLEKESGKQLDRSLSVDEAVAHGAAIYAEMLRRDAERRPMNVKVTNVNSHSLGVLGFDPTTRRRRNRIMIEKNTPLPSTRTSVFRTLDADQRNIGIDIIEGGDPSGNNATAIGQCVIRDLPPQLPAGTEVEVTFTYLSNGRLTVQARLSGLGHQAKLDVKRQSGLSEVQLNQWEQRLRSGLRPLQL